MQDQNEQHVAFSTLKRVSKLFSNIYTYKYAFQFILLQAKKSNIKKNIHRKE